MGEGAVSNRVNMEGDETNGLDRWFQDIARADRSNLSHN